MPALNFEIEWPDGEVMECYSPSTIVRQYLRTGDSFTVEGLVAICGTALDLASKRVEDKFGFRCEAANEQNAKIIRKAACYQPDQAVRILRIQEHSL